MVFDRAHAGSETAAARDISPQTYALFRYVADTAALIVWMTDENDVCISLNKKVRDALQGIRDVRLSDWMQFVHPDDLSFCYATLANARRLQEEYQSEYRIVRSDGTIRWMQGSGAPRFSDEGRFLGFSGTILDITHQHEAMERLRKSEAEYRLLAENTGDLICHTALDGTYLYVSPSYEKVLGYEPCALVGRKAHELVHPDDMAAVAAELKRQAAQPSQGHVLEVRTRHATGVHVWMGIRIQAIMDPATGQAVSAVAVSRDITQERQAREKLERSEERFRSLTQLSSDWYWETDTDDIVTFVSDGVIRAMNLPKDALIGKPRASFALEPNEQHLAVYRQFLKQRAPFRNLPFSARHPVTREPFHVLVSGEPVHVDGQFTGYRGVVRVITAEHELVQELADLAEENQALMENSLDIISMVNEGGLFVRVSEAVKDVLGYTPEEWIGHDYSEFLHPDDLRKTQMAEAGLRNGTGIVKDFECRWRRKDGTYAHLSVSVRWAHDKKMMYSTARDITETYQARQEAIRANDRLSTILESIGDAFFAIDKDWRITYANQKSAAFVGVDRDRALGRTLMEVVPEVVHSSVFPYYQQAMSTGQQLFFEAYYEPLSAWVEARMYPHDGGLSIFFQDISSRRQAEQAIRDSEQRFREMIDMTPAGYFTTDGHGRMLSFNPAFCEMTGYAPNALAGRPVSELFFSCPATAALTKKGGVSLVKDSEATLRHRDGRTVHALINLVIKRDGEGHAQMLSAFVTDITERKEIERQLEDLATHDTLTGLPNRTLVHRQLQHRLNQAEQENTLAVLFIDLDRFKEVNDSMGHAAGDLLLQQVAHRLRHCTRPTDMVARLGGDEFVVVVQCTNGYESASATAEKLLAELQRAFEIHGQEVHLSASIGVSMLSDHSNTRDLLFQNADMAMYRAKTTGRNGYRFYKADMRMEMEKRMVLGQALRRALERNEFEVHYQPRIDLKSRDIIGVEALLRWTHPTLGVVSPAEFIPIAEDNGSIIEIGNWVLGQACRHISRLNRSLKHPLRVSVNLSAQQLKSRTLVDQIGNALKESGLPPDLLELELTETAVIEDFDKCARVLNILKSQGVILSFDDFGTGYSSMVYLKRLPVDILKLDRSFINQRPQGVSTFEFIKALVDMAHALKLSVVAEGVETGEMLSLLTAAECNEGQGYLFARPMSIADLEKFVLALMARGKTRRLQEMAAHAVDTWPTS